MKTFSQFLESTDWKRHTGASYHNVRTNHGVIQHDDKSWSFGHGNPEEYMDFHILGRKYKNKKAAMQAADTHHSLHRMREKRKARDEE